MPVIEAPFGATQAPVQIRSPMLPPASAGDRPAERVEQAHSIATKKIQEAGEQVDEMHDGFSEVIEKIEQALSGAL